MSAPGGGKRKAKELNPEALKKLKAIEEQGGITIRLLVTKAQVGAIIGKGGENVKRLRDENDVFVSVLWSKHKERIAEYKGIPANLAAALRQTAEFFGPLPESKEGHYAVCLLIHYLQVGALIGKGGALSKQCTQETGARLEVSREKKGESTEKVVTITGTLDSIRAAATWVLNQLAQNPLRPETPMILYKPSRPLAYQQPPLHQQPPPPITHPSLIPSFSSHNPYYSTFPPVLPPPATMSSPTQPAAYSRQYSQFGNSTTSTPTPGSPSTSLTPMSPYHNNTTPGGYNPIGTPSRFSSPPPTKNYYSYGDLSTPSPTSSILSPGDNRGVPTYQPTPGGGGFPTVNSSYLNNDLKIRSSTELQIPIHCIPGVIGRGGSIIQNIYRQTQASIKIAEQVNGQKYRVATITGTEMAIRNAVQLIQNRIAELSASPSVNYQFQ